MSRIGVSPNVFRNIFLNESRNLSRYYFFHFLDTVDFLKGISPRSLPGVLELQRRDLLHRAADLTFEDQMEDEEDLDEDNNAGTYYK